MKTLKEHLDLIDWEVLKTRLPNLYSDMNDPTVISKFNKVFNELLILRPEENSEGFEIHINQVIDVSGEHFWAVNGRKKSEDIKYNISFDPWEKWLGYYVNNNHLDHVEIIVHCLYEMTWSGFSQEEIRNKYNEL
ncbi:DUF6557 family protein [Paenibacillus harenae]|uniref:Uncharacterized protein n=1 Tax=Paenibacillus harenae TaxID=306543 RepID=A0ABT9TYM5_PAEHA|nr:DUF6557 family protein [Paenibacillus harenae]MDQ0112462.1 hypothetical protein [Paenibacillus harenae]